MKLFLTLLLALLFISCGHNEFKLQKGDLLFQDLDCGAPCDAIEKVTTGVNGAKFSHVAIVSKIDPDGEAYVIEAYDGVEETPVSEFLKRSHDDKGNPKVVVERLLPEYQYLIPIAVGRAYKLLGKKYDPKFDLENDSYYCSELIYEIFKYDDKGRKIVLFPLNMMTFKEPGTGNIMDVWKKYFRELGIPAPEGKPGINPGAISRSPKIKVVHVYGRPTFWQGAL
jgi:hypothetical protein